MAFLPREQHALTGGYFCKSIRYAVNIPALAEPIDTKDGWGVEAGPTAILPCVLYDHCDSCWQASGSIVQCWLVCPEEGVEWSMLVRAGPGTGSTAAASSRSSDEPSWEEAEDEDRRVCLPTLAAVGTSHPKGDPNGQAAPAEYPRSYLTYLNSSADVTRISARVVAPPNVLPRSSSRVEFTFTIGGHIPVGSPDTEASTGFAPSATDGGMMALAGLRRR